MGHREDCERGLDHPDSIVARQQRIIDAQTSARISKANFNEALQLLRMTLDTPERLQQLLATTREALIANNPNFTGCDRGLTEAVFDCFCTVSDSMNGKPA
jgi:hypothetical protein